MSVEDETLMRRAIALAMRGRGEVEPNPMVGCVIVKEGRVIGEGWHQRYGEPHAEPNALASCSESPRGATAYVTLEPCCHYNKKTPPCTPRLIEAGIARVVAGCRDPNPDVSGKGFELLRKAGVHVDDGVLLDECRQLIAPFFSRIVPRKPYVTLKWAQTADGKIAGPGGARLQIGNEASHRAVHELRARCDAILVGINTVLTDDPLLTARDVSDARPLRRMVLDSRLRVPIESQLVRTAANSPVEIYCVEKLVDSPRAAELRAHGVRVSGLRDDDRRLSVRHLIDELGRGGRVSHLLVEPGPTLAASFMDCNLADRAWVFRSPTAVNAESAPAAGKLSSNFLVAGEMELQGDKLVEYLNAGGTAFFGLVPSADFEKTRASSRLNGATM